MVEQFRPHPRALAESAVLIAGGTAGAGLATAIQFALAGAPGIALIGCHLSAGIGWPGISSV